MGCSFCWGHAHQSCGRPDCGDENPRTQESHYIAVPSMIEPIRVDSIPEHHFSYGAPWSYTEACRKAAEPHVPDPLHDSLFLKFEQLDNVLYKLEQGDGARHSRAREARQLLALIRSEVLK